LEAGPVEAAGTDAAAAEEETRGKACAQGKAVETADTDVVAADLSRECVDL